MFNLMLYVVTVLIWGTTWLAIKWQLGVVPVPVSIAWRFLLASLVLMAVLVLRREWRLPPKQAIPFVLAQGVALFCLNFLCFYHAEQTVPSGLVAVIFSLAPILNAINGKLFLKRDMQASVLVGAIVGLAGIVCLFLPEWQHWEAGMGQGVLVAALGTLCFSSGNLLSSRMQGMGLTPLFTNAWAMSVGAAILTVGSLLAGLSFEPEWTPRYLSALVYLAIPGSVIGFTAYLMLVGRIGPDRAAYCTLLFPVVALVASSLFEHYQWTGWTVLGLLLVVAGNLIGLANARRALWAMLTGRQFQPG